MTKAAKTVTFASTVGMILATAGSAVGLGNVWRFPTMTGENGGAAFILIYMVFNIAIGFVGMLAEFIIGRNGASDPVTSYVKAGGHRIWSLFGVLGALCTSLILSFYSVVAGWCVYYLYLALRGQVLGAPDYIATTFTQLVGADGTLTCCLISVLFVVLTYLVVVRGVQRGIEAASKLMVPLLFILLIVLGAAACSLPGAMSGLEFLFRPDLSKVTWKTVFEAMSNSFFSLSLGVACLVTYAAYIKPEVNLVRSAFQVVCIDVAVAILAGLMVFPAAFSVGVRPDSGPSLIFLTLPNVFTEAFSAGVGYVISIMFYALLVLAALTSTISMLEVGTVALANTFGISRQKAAAIEAVFCCVMATFCAMSFVYPEIGVGGTTLFDNCDYITAKFMMPVGGFFTCILVGWVMPRERVTAQLTSHGRYAVPALALQLFFFLLRFVCPICIAVIFIGQLI